MKYLRGLLTAFVFFFFPLEGTPTSMFWTVCTTDVCPTGTGHIDQDNYFKVFDWGAFYPVIGFELGISSVKHLSFEAGLDIIGGLEKPLFFNAGVAMPEGQLFCNAPAFKLGVFNVGMWSNKWLKGTDVAVVDFIIGKSIPGLIGGRFFVGSYFARKAVGPDRKGFMVAYERFFHPSISDRGQEYFKWKFCADYASGKNIFGGGGVGVSYFFSPDVSILTGPVWFNSEAINGTWKWSVQIDINFSLYHFQ